MDKKKIFNYRPLLFVLVITIIGVLISYLNFNCKLKSLFNFALPIYLFLLGSVIILLVYFLFSKRVTNKSFFIGNLVFYIIVFSLVTLLSFISFNNYLNVNAVNNKNVVITGKVEKINGINYFELEDCEINYNGENYILNKPVTVKFNSNNYSVKIGSEVKLTSVIKFSHWNRNNYNLNDIIENGKVHIEISDESNIETLSYKVSFKQKLKNRVLNLLNKIMGEENAPIAFGVLFGDSSKVNDEVSELFSYAGISHILAVSGLHIGILVALLVFILKKIKSNKYVAFAIVSIFLILYSYICDFSPSVLRAGIMFLIYFGADVLGLRNDKLNSWCLAGSLLLFINPINLFDVGFQLTFVCIFALFFFSGYVNKFLIKMKVNKSICSVLAPSIAINLLTLPITTTIFNKISLLGILSNLVVLPLFSVMYVMLFGLIVICTILPFMAFILIVPEFFIHLLVWFCDLISGIKFGVFNSFSTGYLSLVLCLVALLISNYLLVKAKTKCVISLPIVALAVILFIVNVIPKNYYNVEACSPFKQYTTNSIVLVSDNRVVLVGSIDYKNNLSNFLNKNKISRIDDFLITDFEITNTSKYNELIIRYKIKNVYVPSNYFINNLMGFEDSGVDVKELGDFNINNIYISSKYSIENELIGLDILQGNKRILYSHSNNKNDLIDFLSSVDYAHVDEIYFKNQLFEIDDYFDINYNRVYYVNYVSVTEKVCDYAYFNNKLLVGESWSMNN